MPLQYDIGKRIIDKMTADTPADDRPSVERAKAYFSGRPPGLMSLETWMHGKRLVEALLAAEAALRAYEVREAIDQADPTPPEGKKA